MKILHCFKNFDGFHILYVKVIILARKGEQPNANIIRAIIDVLCINKTLSSWIL